MLGLSALNGILQLACYWFCLQIRTIVLQATSHVQETQAFIPLWTHFANPSFFNMVAAILIVIGVATSTWPAVPDLAKMVYLLSHFL